jgi:hypothetical protein
VGGFEPYLGHALIRNEQAIHARPVCVGFAAVASTPGLILAQLSTVRTPTNRCSMTATRIRLTGPEPLEERATPATLRIVDLPGGITGFGTAGTDPSNPSAQNSELVPAAQLTVPFGPRELGRVNNPRPPC